MLPPSSMTVLPWNRQYIGWSGSGCSCPRAGEGIWTTGVVGNGAGSSLHDTTSMASSDRHRRYRLDRSMRLSSREVRGVASVARSALHVVREHYRRLSRYASIDAASQRVQPPGTAPLVRVAPRPALSIATSGR